MRAVLYAQPQPGAANAKAVRFQAWAEGIRRSGDKVSFLTQSPHQFGDVVISWGIRDAMRAQGMGLHHIVFEVGFLGDRSKWLTVAHSALNGHGRPICPPIAGRGREWYGDLWPSRKGRTEHRNVLIMGQVAGDTALWPLTGGTDNSMNSRILYAQWLAGVVRLCHEQGREVLFRSHPQETAMTAHLPPGVHNADALGWSFEECCEWADVAVAFSSNALVLAYVRGVDVVPAHPQSLCWDVRSHLGQPRRHTPKQRVAWMDAVATHQWSLDEIADGTCWRALRQHL